jgi:hypothetical protein
MVRQLTNKLQRLLGNHINLGSAEFLQNLYLKNDIVMIDLSRQLADQVNELFDRRRGNTVSTSLPIDDATRPRTPGIKPGLSLLQSTIAHN